MRFIVFFFFPNMNTQCFFNFQLITYGHFPMTSGGIWKQNSLFIENEIKMFRSLFNVLKFKRKFIIETNLSRENVYKICANDMNGFEQ